MTSFVYATPYTPPAPPAGAVWRGLVHRWHGWDGSEWILSDHRGGVFLMSGGLRGLSMPATERFASSSAAVAGSRYRDSRALEREVFWPLAVFADGGSEAWIALDRAFWRTMNPRRTGTWTVETPDGQRRSLSCRFVDDGAHAFATDPTFRGWSGYGVRLVAERPNWRGDPIVRTWTAEEPVDFFGGTGGPPFFISSSSTVGTAQVENPGDEDAHPVWLLHGPLDEATVGVGDRLVEVPFALLAGESLVIDTRPVAQTAKVVATPPDGLSAADLLAWVEVNAPAGASRTRDLGAATKFAAVPPGASVTLSLTAVGAGSVQMLLSPLYFRAW